MRLLTAHLTRDFKTRPSIFLLLGFDPFKETQKALAELINDEVSQQQQQQMNGNSGQRSRMPPPPPGFNHMQNNNSFNGFGAASPRSQCKSLRFCCASDVNLNRSITVLAGSKFPFVNMQNTSPMPPQPQSQNNWPMHMGFNQNSNDGGFPPHQPQPQQQHKTTGEHRFDATELIELIPNGHFRFWQ